MDNLKKILETKDEDFNKKLNDNFDEIVFSKIRKKKRTRKKIYSTVIILTFLSLIFTLSFLNHNVFTNLAKSKHNKIKKTEVPIVENMNFASSDNINNYAIEIISKDKKTRRPL